MARLRIEPVRALKDNYVYLLIDEELGAAAAVDPGEAAPVDAALARLGVRLAQVWNTHHHFDHVGGNAELAARHAPIEIFTSTGDRARIPGATRGLADGETFTWAGETVTALHI